ncbi:nucleotidyltransferase substrate binding protein [Candidatus Ruminimicrobium bovinum]|uniref:nucleotidyltransferase substrate binding protein n=1 Tax=Candidatus Ruminimicrobium bovinum TaxID=3242779 RepID=UPI0039B84F2B
MTQINTEFLQKCIDTLKKSYSMIKSSKEGTVDYEMYRNSLVKSFEITLEQSGKMLKKKLVPYFATKKAVDMLSFKDIFRQTHKFSLLNEQEVERWFKYRDNINTTAHDYGIAFAQETLSLIDNFLSDVEKLKKIIEND